MRWHVILIGVVVLLKVQSPSNLAAKPKGCRDAGTIFSHISKVERETKKDSIAQFVRATRQWHQLTSKLDAPPKTCRALSEWFCAAYVVVQEINGDPVDKSVCASLLAEAKGMASDAEHCRRVFELTEDNIQALSGSSSKRLQPARCGIVLAVVLEQARKEGQGASTDECTRLTFYCRTVADSVSRIESTDGALVGADRQSFESYLAQKMKLTLCNDAASAVLQLDASKSFMPAQQYYGLRSKICDSLLSRFGDQPAVPATAAELSITSLEEELSYQSEKPAPIALSNDPAIATSPSALSDDRLGDAAVRKSLPGAAAWIKDSDVQSVIDTVGRGTERPLERGVSEQLKTDFPGVVRPERASNNPDPNNYGRIRGLGKIDTGGGAGVSAYLGKKAAAKMDGSVKPGREASQQFCKRDNIFSVVEKHAGALRACYERELRLQPGLRGKVTLKWEIDLDGAVEKATTVDSSMGSRVVDDCLVKTVRGMQFAKPEGGRCIVQWPFVFTDTPK